MVKSGIKAGLTKAVVKKKSKRKSYCGSAKLNTLWSKKRTAVMVQEIRTVKLSRTLNIPIK